MSIYNTAVTALQSAQIAIATTGHNIANANTPGYRRQEAIIETNVATRVGNGFVGQGVNVSTVRRVYSEFLERQVTRNESQSAYLDQYLQGMQQMNNVLGDRSAGFSATIQKFSASLNSVASDPASIPARQAVLGAANTVANSINSLGNYLQSLQDGIDVDITAMVSKINGFADSIASMNDRIANIQTSGSLVPNDMLDQRDQLVSELNKMAGVTVVKDSSNGNLTVFMGQGFQLVGATGANSISAQASVYDPQRTEVYDATGTVLLSGNSSIGGQLGAILDYRSQSLDLTQNSLGRIAMALTQSVNKQHQLGQDLAGAAGTAFFNSMAALPQAFASANNTNAGTLAAAVVTATLTADYDTSKLTTSDYKLTFDGTNYTLNRLSDGQSWSSNVSLAALATTADQGFSLAEGPAMFTGDSFLIRPTAAAASNVIVAITDPAKIAAAAPVRAGAAIANTGTAQIGQPTVDTGNQPPLNADLTSAVTFTFTSSNTFDVVGSGTGDPTGVAYTAGGNISYNGWTLKISGTPVAGDVFTIGPNTGGTLDNRNALALAALKSNKNAISGNNTLESSYAILVGNVGNKTDEISVNQKAQKNLLDQTRQTQQSASGVNLDEEAANLIRFQQAYQAAAKMISTATTMFEALLNI